MALDTRNGPARLRQAEAIKEIRRSIPEGKRVLGIDGFKVTQEGFVALLDLVLDVSGDDVSTIDAARIAEDFLRSHGAEDLVFEVWME